ncbi:MAG TPA: hypothetical protein VJR89_40780 [Polyangiales bacterium]|nr:hypothetical protein [Polyangiales bacterium]
MPPCQLHALAAQLRRALERERSARTLGREQPGAQRLRALAEHALLYLEHLERST